MANLDGCNKKVDGIPLEMLNILSKLDLLDKEIDKLEDKLSDFLTAEHEKFSVTDSPFGKGEDISRHRYSLENVSERIFDATQKVKELLRRFDS